MKPNKTMKIGIGTFIVLAGLVLVAAVRLWNMPSPSPQVGRIIYQADASGHLNRVDGSTAGAATLLPRLWKPQVGFLLSHGSQLRLTGAQRQLLAVQDKLWNIEKQTMVQAMRQSTADLSSSAAQQSGQPIPMGQLATSLNDYSAQSVRYDERRRHYWDLGMSVLTSPQRATLDGLRTQ